MSDFHGCPGDCTFRIHAHADATDRPWLFLWGADVATE